MQPLRRLAQFYVDLLVKLGIWKFSMLLAFIIIVFAMGIQMSVTWIFEGRVEKIDLIRSVFFGIVVTPWAVFFLSVVVDQIEESRRQLTELVDELEDLHQREAKQNQQLNRNIKQLNQEIVDRIKAEQARLQIVEALKEEVIQRKRYQDALEQASRDKTTFISTISHELRTPLNGIIGLSRILADTSLTAQQQNYLNTIQISAITLSNIFNDIIEVDKLERGRQKLDIRPIDFIRFLADLENIASLLIKQKGLGFNFKLLFDELNQQMPLSIATDETRLRQILWNLISNAVKFTEKGYVEIRVFFDNTDKNQLIFEVEDTGAGIPNNELNSIFEMYYQVKDKFGGKPATGTGIGLAVSRTLARNLGGDIKVISEINHGSCFQVSIHAPTAMLLADNGLDTNLTGMRVLLVEDIELNILVASSVLEKLGCEVMVARTGNEALTNLATYHFDLALLDIQLPDMTGLDIAKRFKQNPDKPVRLIALTANVLEDYTEYHLAGIEAVLNKPLSIAALTTVLSGNLAQDNKDMIYQSPFKVTLSNVPENEIVFDKEVINEYIQMIGKDALIANVNVFSQSIPEYLSALRESIETSNLAETASIGHKIKGASASIGLLRLQAIAKLIQDEQSPADWLRLNEYYENFNNIWQVDIKTLKHWIDHQNNIID